ncbi:hypothetical protein SDC9_111275 [bioreactor metagenome]|uniref:Uncharacterized protein n=1 Tax=bioreactor metagenome TaxID=1076179 RepID=A0A645BG18_9ZZZZ
MNDIGCDGAQLALFGAINQIRVVLSAPEHRCTAGIAAFGIILQRIAFGIFLLHQNQRRIRAERLVFQVHRYRLYFQLVDLVELFRFGEGCTSHAGELLVHTEVILNGDGSVCNVFWFNIDVLFGFYSLMQAF